MPRAGRRTGWTAVCAALLAASAFAGGALGTAPAADASRAPVRVVMAVSRPGRYAVTVVVTGRSTRLNRVTVTIGALTRTVHTSRHHRALGSKCVSASPVTC
jgi:hypothetical protein